MTVRFLMSNNRPSSITRIVADTANVFTRQGVTAVVHYPAVDWWDYRVFTLSRLGLRKKLLSWIRLLLELVAGWVARPAWCGFRLHPVDSRVQAVLYGVSPSARDWKEGDVALVHPPYLLPGLLKTLPNDRIKVVTALHVNLEKALQSPVPETAAWYAHWVAFNRLLSIPTIVTSRETEEGARRLGIRVDKLIYGGIDLGFFHPPETPRSGKPLTVTLYCDSNPQKGRELGVAAIRALKKRFPEVRMGSLGNVTPDQAKEFDHNHGYLHGEEYARVLRESDIFVYPSLYDGFPAPPLQAMACGAAVVTTAVEGVSAYAAHEENALVCPPGEGEALQNNLIRLLTDAGLRQKLAGNGPVMARRHSVEQSAEELLEFLKKVGAEKGL